MIEKIFNLNLKILDRTRIIEEYQGKIEEISFGFMSIITSEVDMRGKPKFGNAESRKAELLYRLKQSENYQETKVKLDNMKYEKALLEFELEKQKNLLRLFQTLIANEK